MTKGQIEAAISAAVAKFEKEYTGRGPSDVRTYVVDDMILVRLKGLLLPVEERLIAEQDSTHWRDAIKHFRGAVIEKARSVLEPVIADATGRKLVSMFSDISTKTDERVIVFTLDGVVEFAEHASTR
jgi:uncharacterized protein YbcI